MDTIKKKMATFREKLEASEERARKAEDELSNTYSKVEEVSFVLIFVVIDLYNLLPNELSETDLDAPTSSIHSPLEYWLFKISSFAICFCNFVVALRVTTRMDLVIFRRYFFYSLIQPRSKGFFPSGRV